MPAGSYEARTLSETLAFVHDHHTYRLNAYDWRERATGRTRRVVQGEVSNGVWAVGYWKGSLP
jgi:hypothetical protein